MRSSIKYTNGFSPHTEHSDLFKATNLEKVPEMDGDYKLIISLGSKDYSAKITSLNNFDKAANNFSNSELYLSAFNKGNIGDTKKVDAILKIFNENFKMDKNLLYTVENGVRVIDIVKDYTNPDNGLGGGKTSVIEYTICTHYYLVVDTYHSNNNLIDSETTDLGVYCIELTTEQTDFIAPDPNSGGTETETLEGGGRSVELNLGSVEEYTDTNGAPRRQWNVSWSFAGHSWRNFNLFGVSTEQCNTKYVAGNWEWVSVVNQTYYTGGTVPSGWSYVKDGYSVNYTSTKASVQFTSHLEYVMRGFNKTTSPSSTFYDAYKR